MPRRGACCLGRSPCHGGGTRRQRGRRGHRACRRRLRARTVTPRAVATRTARRQDSTRAFECCRRAHMRAGLAGAAAWARRPSGSRRPRPARPPRSLAVRAAACDTKRWRSEHGHSVGVCSCGSNSRRRSRARVMVWVQGVETARICGRSRQLDGQQARADGL
eukprot:2079078-Prymnesium_polylepis.1